MLLLSLCLFGLVAPVSAQDGDFEASGLMRAETRWLVNTLERLHFSEMSLEDIEMSSVIESFMENLDNNRLYFTAADLDQFRSRFAPPMERHIRSGNLNQAFQIFTVFSQRVLERTEWVRDYLDKDFSFDEGLIYETDREEVPWPANAAEMDALWEARIQYELLNEVLARTQPAEDGAGDEETPLAEGVREETEDAGDDSNEPLSFDEALAEAKEVVLERHERLETEINRFEAFEVQEMFLTTLANTYDPHSLFLSADSLEDLSIAIENSLVGIGAVLSDQDGYCTIRELIPGGPAQLGGEIGVDDQIIAVAQGEDGEFVDVIGMKLRKIVKMIRGEKGTTVRLKIRPGDAPDPATRAEVALVRDEVRLTANLASARLYQVPGEGGTVSIGVINLPSFYGAEDPAQPNSSSDVAKLIAKLKDLGVEGLILDLRGNGGGLLGEAVELAGLFIPGGPVVQVKTVEGRLLHHDDKDPDVAWEGPLMVLVSRFTASASEIVAGALQNYERALVVGDRTTHGKGTVQGIFRMTPPLFYSLSSSNEKVGATKVTVQKYYLPNGESTQIEGIRSDVIIPSVNDYISVGEADLDNSLPWDTIRPLSFGITGEYADKLVTIDDSMIASLREESVARMEELDEFSLLRESIDFFRTKRDETTISLDLEERRKKRTKDLALQASFRERRESLGESFFPFDPVNLDAKGSDEDGDGSAAGKDEEPLDIVLREGIRIMSDWLSIRKEDEADRRLAKSDA